MDGGRHQPLRGEVDEKSDVFEGDQEGTVHKAGEVPREHEVSEIKRGVTTDARKDQGRQGLKCLHWISHLGGPGNFSKKS